MKLTQKQVDELVWRKDKWKENKKKIINILKSFSIRLELDELENFMEVFLPTEEKRLLTEYRQKNKTDNTYMVKAEDYVIGRKYHIAWADKKCVFVLIKIEGEFAFLDNPKYKRKTLLKTELKDLYDLREKL